MKPITDEYPLLGHDPQDDANFNESYSLAKDIVDLIVTQKKSYAEACRAFDIAKKGLETLKLNY